MAGLFDHLSNLIARFRGKRDSSPTVETASVAARRLGIRSQAAPSPLKQIDAGSTNGAIAELRHAMAEADKRQARTDTDASLLLAVLTGCGGDGSEGADSSSTLSADEQKAADNLSAQIIRSGSMSQPVSENSVTEEQADCIAEGAVAEVGLAELQEYGIVTDDLLVNKSIQGVEMDAEDADALAGVFIECIDAEALFEGRFLAGLPKRGSEQDRRACVQEAVVVDAVQEVLAASFRGAPADAYADMQQAVSSCAGGKDQGKGQGQ